MRRWPWGAVLSGRLKLHHARSRTAGDGSAGCTHLLGGMDSAAVRTVRYLVVLIRPGLHARAHKFDVQAVEHTHIKVISPGTRWKPTGCGANHKPSLDASRVALAITGRAHLVHPIAPRRTRSGSSRRPCPWGPSSGTGGPPVVNPGPIMVQVRGRLLLPARVLEGVREAPDLARHAHRDRTRTC